MASILQLWLLLLSSFLISLTSASASSSSNQRHLLQSPSPPPPQNIQTFFPSVATPAFITSPILPPPTACPPSSSSDRSKITKAVVATALSTFAFSFLVFFIFHWFIRKYQSRRPPTTFASSRSFSVPESVRKDMITNEDGVDVLYWRNHAGGSNSLKRCEYCNRIFDQSVDPASQQEVLLIPHNRHSRHKIQELPLLPSNSISSSSIASKASFRSSSKSSYADKIIDIAQPPPPPPPSPPPPKAPPLPPPPPPMMKRNPPAPPPPMPPMPPRPSSLGASKNSAAALPHGGGGSSRPPIPVPVPSMEGGRGRTKLKPLHWDKMTPSNPEHSMVWDRINDGSFRFDDELMDSLFAYSGTNQNSNNNTTKSTATSTNPFSSSPTTSTNTPALLDPRKTQNFAIVLRSVGISCHLIIDALMEGRGLSHDALEKLSRITPTKEEEAKILQFSGNPTKLSDSESFLYHLLKTVPSAFSRVDAMLFRSNYDPEILHLKTSIQTLELACKELRSHDLFLKLLEAILKAGNRMNAGTARGNAKAFNLTALCKLSDVKSTDGKTTLLHFVVEEVVRSEGKRLVINRNHSLRRSSSGTSSSYSGNLQANSGELRTSREEKEKEYIKLGLPIVGCLSEELANVKKSATVDYDALVASCSSLEERISKVRQLLSGCGNGEGFLKEMKGFVEVSEEELKVVMEEQIRVMELVKRTTDYFQPGASNDKNAQLFQLFVIIRDFFGMFDKVCIDITKKFQKKPVKASSAENSPMKKSEAKKRPVVRFPNLPPRFLSENKSSSDSDSDGGF